MSDITIIRRPQGGSSGGVNIDIDKNQFLATEGQTSFIIQNTITTNDLLIIHVNNLFLEQDINYSLSEDSVSRITTITLPSLKLNDVVSWILIKVGDTPITPEQKQAICGMFNCGDLRVGEGIENTPFEVIQSSSSLSDEFLKIFS